MKGKMNLSHRIQEIIISPNSSLLECLKKMDRIQRKLLIVYDDEIFMGLLSIGDIQRAIISNIQITSTIASIIRNNYIVANKETTIEEIKKMMFEIRAEFMPVVSDFKKLINVYFWEDLFSNKLGIQPNQFTLPVVIMAGGIGSRLKPLTNVLPKPLIPIGEKTIIEEIFLNFGKHGCNEFFISVNYKAELIEFYLQTQKLPYKVEFIKEEKPMGTVGSLAMLRGKINKTFFISNCDILIDQDYSEILDYHINNKNEITIVAALKHYPIPYGTIESGENGQLLNLIEKPELTFKINSGMYILEPHVLTEIPENTFFHITELIDKVRERNGKVGVFPVSEKSWKDIGDWSLYLKEI